MKNLEPIKTIVEITIILMTFPEYVPLLAVVAALGAVYYYLIQEEDSNNEEKEPDKSIPEVIEECPDTKQLRSSQTSLEIKQ